MITKWEVAPAPSEKNPTRHKLLIKGEMRDMFLLIKKLGSLCSRPEKTSGAFDFVVYLFKLEPDTLAKIKSLTFELGAPTETTPPRIPAPASQPLPELFETPRPKINTASEPEPAPAASNAPAAAPSAAVPQDIAQPAAGKPGQNAGHDAPFVPSAASRKKTEPVKPEEKPREVVKPVGIPVQPSLRGKTKWSVELPLVPTHSFQTLISGSHNRFAHAAAMAVVENPGLMYNPLLIFGAPGTGKTHFVHAISYGLSSSIGQNNIFVTDGIKLSKGVDLAVKNGTIDKLSETMSKVKVLIIDDIHLLMLTDTNKKHITKWLNEFMTKNKQIVVTSVFPPKSLGGLEEAVGFQFTQGWMVDLKPPAPQAYKVVLNQLLQGMDVRLSEEELNSIFSRRGVPFGEAIRTLGSMKKLEKFIVNAMSPATHAQLLDMMLGFSEPKLGSSITEEEYGPVKNWKPAAAGSWFKWGFFYPKGMKQEAPYVQYRLHERSVEMGLKVEWQQIFMEEYNPDELFGIPFKVGDFASEQNVNGIIIMGPQPTSALGAQEAEFRHITLKILDSFLIKGAWIQFSQIKAASSYTKTLMDLL